MGPKQRDISGKTEAQRVPARKREPLTEPWTPGPWRVVQNRFLHYVHVVAASVEGRVADCADSTNPMTELEANARLIAAAPEMAEALQACIDSAAYDSPAIRVARALLARISG